MKVPHGEGVLDDDGMREIDRVLLDYLQNGRITPVYARERIVDNGIRESITEQYCQQRLKRLVEHNHAVNLFNVGLYELESDPRERTNE
jgi:hypothetical protein